MFTGIVRERGRVLTATGGAGGRRLVVDPRSLSGSVAVGDSVAVDGVCLTVVQVDGGTFAFDVVAETLERSTLGRLAPGDEVNLETAVRAGEPLGGHIVQGHVDAVGTVRSSEPDGDGRRLSVAAPQEVLRLCVEKGSITVQGVSLTVARLDEGGLAFALVPHTLRATTLGRLSPGDLVNLEADVVAKHVERLLGTRAG